MRTAILFVVALCGIVRAETVDDLRHQLSTGKPAAQAKAADKLGGMGHDATAAVPDLVNALANGSLEVRSHAIIALGKIGDKAALPPLDFISRDATELGNTKKLATEAIANIGPLKDEEKAWLARNRKTIVVRGKPIDLPQINLATRSHKIETALQIGMTGVLSWKYGIVQILGPNDMLIVNPYGDNNPPILAHGFPTQGLLDDGSWQPAEPIVAVGASSYTDVMGGNRTVLTIIPIAVLRNGITFEQFLKLSKE